LDVLPHRTMVFECRRLAGGCDQRRLAAARRGQTRCPDPAEQRRDEAQAAQARQEQRDRRLAGWAAAVCDALTDTQLADAVQRVARPVAGLDRRSAPVAASQLLAWAISAATAAPDTPLDAALTNALHDHAADPDSPMIELPEDIPPAPATNAAADPEAFRRRVRHAINDLEA
jgi:hypothetical protein